MECLNDDILYAIFKKVEHLSPVPFVCKQWKRVSKLFEFNDNFIKYINTIDDINDRAKVFGCVHNITRGVEFYYENINNNDKIDIKVLDYLCSQNRLEDAIDFYKNYKYWHTFDSYLCIHKRDPTIIPKINYTNPALLLPSITKEVAYALTRLSYEYDAVVESCKSLIELGTAYLYSSEGLYILTPRFYVPDCKVIALHEDLNEYYENNGDFLIQKYPQVFQSANIHCRAFAFMKKCRWEIKQAYYAEHKKLLDIKFPPELLWYYLSVDMEYSGSIIHIITRNNCDTTDLKMYIAALCTIKCGVDEVSDNIKKRARIIFSALHKNDDFYQSDRFKYLSESMDISQYKFNPYLTYSLNHISYDNGILTYLPLNTRTFDRNLTLSNEMFKHYGLRGMRWY